MKLFGAHTARVNILVRAFGVMMISCVWLVQAAQANEFKINEIIVDGNQRIETATIRSYSEIETPAVLTTGAVNDAVQRVRASNLFESVSAEVQGNRLKVTVVEFPTVNEVAFEGNDRLSSKQLSALVRSQSRRVYSVSQVRDDANAIAKAYANQGRISASVEPRIIRRSDNRVDVVFEIVEGGVVEIERLSFVGNRKFSDRRLRRVLNTKQAGLLRAFIQRDTYIEDRVELDKQVLTEFYKTRGYIDFQVQSVTSELSKTRDSFFITFRVQEGQQFSFGEITTTSSLEDVDLSPLVFLILINILVLLLGCVLDATVIILVIVPLFIPTCEALGIDLVHFGVLVVVNSMIGLITPPYGILLFVINAVTGIPLKEIISEVWVFLGVLILALLLIISGIFISRKKS